MTLLRSYSQENEETVRNFEAVLTPDVLGELLGANPRGRLLDVRTPGEYETVHIPGAYNVPLDSLAAHTQEIRVTMIDTVALICQFGARARNAEEALWQCSMLNRSW